MGSAHGRTYLMTMKTLQYAGFSAPESYAAIKAISKKHPEKVLPLRGRFLAGFEAKILADDAACTKEQAREMAMRVWQIIDDTTNYSYNASHAVCVALDSLYGAYAKAHFPMEYYTTLLQTYADKGDKERVALVKEEMLKGFGIRVVPCRFRQDNRDYYIDHENNAISDALTSVKFISKRVADALYAMRANIYTSFTDLLYDLEMHPAIDSNVVQILIRMGYFEEFGSKGKLLKLQGMFRDGPDRFSKTLIPLSQEKRLAHLRELEQGLPEESLPIHEQAQFEITYLGTMLSTFQAGKGMYAVLDVDDRHSPKIRLYNLATGATGIVKAKKDTFNSSPLAPGDVIKLTEWERRQAYSYVNGAASPKEGVFDIWALKYAVIQ